MQWLRSSAGYLRHIWREGGKVQSEAMHRLVWAWEYGWENVPRYIDHINGDRTDNRLENLRPTTLSLNAHNARKKAKGLPRGVSLDKKSAVNPYIAGINHRNRTIHLGMFATVEEAQAAYDVARTQIMEYEAALASGGNPAPPVIEVKKGRIGKMPLPADERVAELHRAGRSLAAIGRELKLNYRTVKRMLVDLGLVPVDKPPSPGTLDARSAPQQEQSDDYGNDHGERGQGTRSPHDAERQDDGELLGGLDGEEGRSDDVG